MMARLLTVIAAAKVATATHSDDDAVRATLQRAFPQSPVQGITKTPVPGVLEAAIDGQVFYQNEQMNERLFIEYQRSFATHLPYCR